MAKKRIKYWILKDGRNYFEMMTGIGPCATQKKAEAERFKTKREAMMSPASTFSLMSYEPFAVR